MSQTFAEIPSHVLVRIPDVLLHDFRYEYLKRLGLPVFRDYTYPLGVDWDDEGHPIFRPRKTSDYGLNFEAKLFRLTYRYIVDSIPPSVVDMIAARAGMAKANEPCRDFDSSFVVISAEEDRRIEDILAGNPGEMVRATLIDGRVIEYGFDNHGLHPTTFDTDHNPVPIVVENSDKHLVVVNYELRGLNILIRREANEFVAKNANGQRLIFNDLEIAYEFLKETDGDLSTYKADNSDESDEDVEYEYSDY